MEKEYVSTELREFFYRQMFTIRLVEETLLDLFSKGLLAGTTHTCIGQEACAVGVVNALDKERDIIFSNHRNHGHFIAYCDKVEELIAEVMGRESGVCRGIGGSQHIHYKNFYSSGIQGGLVPSAAGVAFAEKVKDTGAIVVVFIGDGTLGQGVVYETLNIASLWSLPLLFVVENNQYAQSTPVHLGVSGEIAKRAEPFGIISHEIDGFDVFNVYFASKRAVDFVRREKRPFFLVLHTYRLGPHSKGNDYRPVDEIAKYRRMDPLKIIRKSLDPEKCKEIEKEVKERVMRAVKAANDASLLPLDKFYSRSIESN